MATCMQNSLWLMDGQSFVLCRPSADWMKPTHILENNCFTPSPWISMLIFYTHTSHK